MKAFLDALIHGSPRGGVFDWPAC